MEHQVAAAIAHLLDAADVGDYSPSTPYAAGQVGIFTAPGPYDVPESIQIATYPVTDDLDADSILGVQLTIRSATRTALLSRCDAAFAVLHARYAVTVDAVRLSSIERRSAADLGLDGTLHARTENYYVRLSHPTTNRY